MLDESYNLIFQSLDDPKFKGRRVDVAWDYLKQYFSDQDDFVRFLNNLNGENREMFLEVMRFYYVHDVHREQEFTQIDKRNFDVWFYITTLSIAERIMAGKGIDDSWKRVKAFFAVGLSEIDQNTLSRKVEGRGGKNDISGIRVLYHLRNGFIHQARWFNLNQKEDGSFANVSKAFDSKDQSYLAVVKITLDEYLDFFWKALLKHFGKGES